MKASARCIVLAAAILFAPILSTLPWAAAQTSQKDAVVYVCPMHPDVKSVSPGKCPKCSMALKAERAADIQKLAGSKKADESAAPGVIEKIPNPVVYDQSGKKLNFYTDLVKNKTVAIEFIFTTCTTICPPLTATLRKVQQDLGDRVGQDIQLISVTVDPVNDNPERLKEFAERFGAGAGWSFVTGNKPDIDRLLSALGAYVADRNQHSPMILIGNESAGYWTRTYGLAPASKLTQLINEAAAKGKAAKDAANNSAATVSPAQAAAHYFPNTELVTQDNAPVRFYSDLMQGKVVLINFMFTTCTSICPTMTANLVKVRQYLGGHVGKDVNIISITVDPTADTPAVLKKYAEFYKVNEPGWYFLTGDKQDVSSVLQKLGGYVDDKNDHSTFVIVGNPETGQWLKMFAMSRPDQIANAVLKMIPVNGTGQESAAPRSPK